MAVSMCISGESEGDIRDIDEDDVPEKVEKKRK